MNKLSVLLRALNILESDPTELMGRYLTGLGFTNTHYKGMSYDKIGSTSHMIHVGDNPYPKYSIVSADFENKSVTAFNPKEGKYKRIPFSNMKADYNGKITAQE